jgi:hypothetical protein
MGQFPLSLMFVIAPCHFLNEYPSISSAIEKVKASITLWEHEAGKHYVAILARTAIFK